LEVKISRSVSTGLNFAKVAVIIICYSVACASDTFHNDK